MDGKKLVYDKGSEILFRLKLDVLREIINDGNFHKKITDINSLVLDLREIIENYENKRVEGKDESVFFFKA